jgi:hypothetical protein
MFPERNRQMRFADSGFSLNQISPEFRGAMRMSVFPGTRQVDFGKNHGPAEPCGAMQTEKAFSVLRDPETGTAV